MLNRKVMISVLTICGIVCGGDCESIAGEMSQWDLSPSVAIVNVSSVAADEGERREPRQELVRIAGIADPEERWSEVTRWWSELSRVERFMMTNELPEILGWKDLARLVENVEIEAEFRKALVVGALNETQVVFNEDLIGRIYANLVRPLLVEEVSADTNTAILFIRKYEKVSAGDDLRTLVKMDSAPDNIAWQINSLVLLRERGEDDGLAARQNKIVDALMSMDHVGPGFKGWLLRNLSEVTAAPLLVEGLQSEDRTERFAAIGGLIEITGETFGFHQDGDEKERAAAIKRWVQWLHERQEKDPANNERD